MPGDYTWSGVFDSGIAEECSSYDAPIRILSVAESDSVFGSAQEFSIALESLKQVRSFYFLITFF